MSFNFFTREASPRLGRENGGFKKLFSVSSLTYPRCLIEFIEIKNNILNKEQKVKDLN